MSQEDHEAQVVAADATDRIVKLDHVFNFRSTGGLRTIDGRVVRHGFLFRSSNFDNATDADLQKLTDPSSIQMHVKTIVDLRDKKDAANEESLLRKKYYVVGKIHHRRKSHPSFEAPKKADKASVYQWINIPILTLRYKMNVLRQTPDKRKVIGKGVGDMFKGTAEAAKYVVGNVINKQGMTGQYKDMLQHSQKNFLNVLELLVDAEDEDDAPVAVHCEHGKDRTGLVIMLVYSILGVSEDDIVADYALSSHGLEGLMDEKMRLEMVEKLGMKEEFIQSPPEVMREILSFMKEHYGGIPKYLKKIGFDEEQQEKLRQLFLVQPQEG